MIQDIAVVKPDHIGDLVLAAPAIGRLAEQSRRMTLFVQKRNMQLARHMFPNLEIEAIAFDHLDKENSAAGAGMAKVIAPTRGRDLVVFLREDELINRERVAHLVGPCIFPVSREGRHESANHRDGIRPYFGNYDCANYWVGHTNSFPELPGTVGLCLGSGFPANKWSVIRWVELARRLISRGRSIRLIGGFQERSELEIVAETAGVDRKHVIVGGADISAFLESLRDIDVVVASDGGSAHLCSLEVPVLSIAASVPFRRFAPFGSATRVLSLDLPCSPCLNAHHSHINACFSHECSYGIEVEHVLDALEAPAQPPGTVLPLGPLAKLFYGLSHVPEPAAFNN